MPAALITPALIAGGDINTSRFISLSTSEDHTALESNSGDTIVIGISNEGARAAPQGSASALHAADGDPVSYHPPGDECLLLVGSGGCTAGDYLKPDNDGKGVTGTRANGNFFALETRNAAELVRGIVYI